MNTRVVTMAVDGERHWEAATQSTTTVGELAAAVGVRAPVGQLLVDGCAVTADRTLVDADVTLGARLELAPDAPTTDRAGAAPACAVRLEQLAGLGAGAAVELGAGLHAIGPSLIEHDDEGLDAGLVAEARSIITAQPGATDQIVATDGAVFRITSSPLPSPPARRPAPGGRGVITLHRTPRPTQAPASEPPGSPALPAAPAAPAGCSLVMLLGPLPVVAVMAVAVSARFALVGLAAPVLTAGRWIESRLRYRRRRRQYERAVVIMRTEHDTALRRFGDHDVVRRWAVHPDAVTLLRAATHARAPVWHVRAGDDDALTLMVGAGSLGTGSRGTVGDSHGPPAGPVPIVVSLRRHRAVGIAGPHAATRAVARWLVAQAAALHGPADLVVSAALDTDATRAWDWLKWLPHLTDDSGARRVVRPGDHGALAAMLHDGTARDVLLLVDGTDAARAEPVREAVTSPASAVHAVVVASAADELPAWCDVVVQVSQLGTAHLSGDGVLGVEQMVATGVSEAWASTLARTLGRLEDPELGARAHVPADVALADLLGLTPLLDAPDALAEHVGERWAARCAGHLGTSLASCVGATATGSFALDLVADGPHALVAGTTGAGKSELLRSWIVAMAASASPDELNFVLVDFKGGGAFDACAELPHTTAVVTDLDAPLAARALRCLRAEVRYREATLRAFGCNDIAQHAAAAPSDPLPRLVVVIDELATLVAELPDFVGSIVDVAQRGRSLGIHLVLATQRPSGVIDHKVRANTNLRIALRVQDDTDSLDVLGVADAARVPRTPGRAVVRLGSGEVTHVQLAGISRSTTVRPAPARVVAYPFTLDGDAAAARPQPGGAPGPSDIERLVGAARMAARQAGYRPPRRPWPPPLPSHLDAVDLWAIAPHEPWNVPLGLADEPDEQRQSPWSWRAADGNLLVLGSEPGATARVLTTLALGLAAHHGPDTVHLYAIDGGGGGLAPWAELPHCGALVSGDDTARVVRVVDVLRGIVERRRALLHERRLTRVEPSMPSDDGGATLPLVVLLVEHAGAVVDSLEAAGEHDAVQTLTALVRDGVAAGVVVALSARHERSLPGRLVALVHERITLRLADPAGYLALGLAPRTVPALSGLRGVVLGIGLEVQFAEVADPDAMTRTITHDTVLPSAPALPVPVRSLGSVVTVRDLVDDRSSIDSRAWTLTVGATLALEPARLHLPPGVHALVSGPPVSGRSNALAAIAHAATRASAGEVAVLTVTPRSSCVRALPGAVDVVDASTLAAAVDACAGAPCLVLVDDAELLAPPLGAALAQLAERAPDGLRLAVAGRAEQLRAPGSWSNALRHGRTGIVLHPAPGDGDTLRAPIPLRSPLAPGPGRGFVVSLGHAQPAQVLLYQ